MNYLTLTDLQNRLTEAGVRFVADRNRDGSVDATESTAYLTSAIEYAGNLIDGYICRQVPPATARSAQNGWLRDRAIDLASHRAAGQGGRSVPATLTTAQQASLEELQRVQDGAPIPGFPSIAPANAAAISRTPKAANLS